MNEEIIDYLHSAMDDAQRAAFEARMRDDATLRAEVMRQRKIQRGLSAAVEGQIASAEPPATMTFAAIAPNIRRKPSVYQRFSYSFAAIAAIVVLFFAVAYSLPDDSTRPTEGNPIVVTVVSTPFSTVEITTTLTITTNSVNAPSIPVRTPTPLLESSTGGNSIITRTPTQDR